MKLNYWVDVLLVVFLGLVGGTGLILKFFFVSGVPGAGRRVLFFGFDKMSFLHFHEVVGFFMLIFMLLHLVLHFEWLSRMTKKLFSKG